MTVKITNNDVIYNSRRYWYREIHEWHYTDWIKETYRGKVHWAAGGPTYITFKDEKDATLFVLRYMR